MNRKAIIIGATGVVGREVLRELIQRREISEIVTFTRKEQHFESEKVINYVIDFDEIEKHADLINGEYLFSCLGTTKSQAGSIANQRIVDLDYQYLFAKLAQKNGVHHYHLVSSPSANSKSNNEYLKMKGELEDLTMKLDFVSSNYYRPSLINADRNDFRMAEKVGIFASSLMEHIPGLKKYKAITGSVIAKKMVNEAMKLKHGKHFFELDELFDFGDKKLN